MDIHATIVILGLLKDSKRLTKNRFDWLVKLESLLHMCT